MTPEIVDSEEKLIYKCIIDQLQYKSVMRTTFRLPDSEKCLWQDFIFYRFYCLQVHLMNHLLCEKNMGTLNNQ